ncbi:MAG: hypothetical protein LBB73_02535, partial [Dysgonamonadaceae bacterium]|nr:hypothetical protein [Dysgonamonadaceae bacterium]
AAKYKYKNTSKTLTFIVFYLIVITGTICLIVYMLVALIVGLIAFVVMFMFSRGGGLSAGHDEDRQGKLNEDLDFIDRTSSSNEEREVRRNERIYRHNNTTGY